MTNEYESYVNGIYENFDKFQIIKNEDRNEDFSKHFGDWCNLQYPYTIEKMDGINHTSLFLNRPGQFFLYEKLVYKYDQVNGNYQKIYYPKIGMYINSIPCDQTFEIEWVNIKRTWEFNKKYQSINNVEGVIKEYDVLYLPTQIQRLIIWNDDMFVYGVWDKLPDWKTLRKYYERTWWFKKTIQQKRDIMLNNLINE
jgi:hypothetical protein